MPPKALTQQSSESHWLGGGGGDLYERQYTVSPIRPNLNKGPLGPKCRRTHPQRPQIKVNSNRFVM